MRFVPVRPASLIAILLATPLVGCGSQGAPPVPPGVETRASHPNPAFLLSNDSPVPVHILAQGGSTEREGGEWGWLSAFPDESAVGTLDSGGHEDLGELLDAAVTSSGAVVVLDGSESSLLIFGPDGSLRQTLGGPGEGPGEFDSPVSLSIGLGDTIVVADRAAMVHRFVPEGDGFAYLDRIRLSGVAPRDACVSQGRLFVLGDRYVPRAGSSEWAHSSTGSIHQIAEDGSVVNSFSVPYRSENSLAVQFFSGGSLTCDPLGDMVWAAYWALGEVHAFLGSGEPRWIARTEDFQVRLLESEQGGVMADGSPERIDQLKSIFLLSPTAVVATVESWHSSNSGLVLIPEVPFFVLDPATGRVMAAGEGVGFLGGGGGIGVAGRNDPFPQFAAVRKVTAGGDG